jgi:hypothetical protein
MDITAQFSTTAQPLKPVDGASHKISLGVASKGEGGILSLEKSEYAAGSLVILTAQR